MTGGGGQNLVVGSKSWTPTELRDTVGGPMTNVTYVACLPPTGSVASSG